MKHFGQEVVAQATPALLLTEPHGWDKERGAVVQITHDNGTFWNTLSAMDLDTVKALHAALGTFIEQQEAAAPDQFDYSMHSFNGVWEIWAERTNNYAGFTWIIGEFPNEELAYQNWEMVMDAIGANA